MRASILRDNTLLETVLETEAGGPSASYGACSCGLRSYMNGVLRGGGVITYPRITEQHDNYTVLIRCTVQ